jgi:ribosome-binding factor A
VAETLDSVLAGDSRDELLRALRVAAVTPAPDGSRFVVTVAARPSADRLDPDEVVAHLARASGWLRSEVAAAVTRRRAPTLAFRFVLGETDA